MMYHVSILFSVACVALASSPVDIVSNNFAGATGVKFQSGCATSDRCLQGPPGPQGPPGVGSGNESFPSISDDGDKLTLAADKIKLIGDVKIDGTVNGLNLKVVTAMLDPIIKIFVNALNVGNTEALKAFGNTTGTDFAPTEVINNLLYGLKEVNDTLYTQNATDFFSPETNLTTKKTLLLEGAVEAMAPLWLNTTQSAFGFFIGALQTLNEDPIMEALWSQLSTINGLVQSGTFNMITPDLVETFLAGGFGR